MNYFTHRNRMERQLYLYIDFLTFCETNQDRLKILDEIMDLRFKIQRIDRMTGSEAYVNVDTITLILESDFK